MPSPFDKEVSRHKMRGDDNNIYTVVKYMEQIPAQTLKNPSGMAHGKLFYELEDGSKVNELKNGTYQVVQTGVILSPTEA